MALPNVDSAKIRLAIDTFDQVFASKPEWARWSDNKSQFWALSFNGKLYPPKQIISIATDVPVKEFRGGRQANSYLAERGFEIVPLREIALDQVFEALLTNYHRARQSEQFTGNHDVRELLEEAARIVGGSTHLRVNNRLRVQTGYGIGGWAEIPWLAVLAGENSMQAGTYVVYLFRADGRGVYLALAQGVNNLATERGARASELLKENASRLHPLIQGLEQRGFAIPAKVELNGGTSKAKLYEASSIVSKFYQVGRIPAERDLLDDLDDVVGEYIRLEGSIRQPQRRVTTDSDERKIALVGTWDSIRSDLARVKGAIKTKGAWASWWSFPIKREAESRLKTPFHLYLNEGSGRIVARLVVDQFESKAGNDGIPSPWPEFTDNGVVGLRQKGSRQSEVFKTWLRARDVQLIGPALRIESIEPVDGLSHERSVLNQSTFGYIYDPMPPDSAAPTGRAAEPDTGSFDLDWLQRQTLLPAEILGEMVATLTQRSPQLLLAGPPGTSKTWVARALARHITAGRDGAVRFIQFHPSYSYEAFVEGLRPVSREGGIGFALTPGVVQETIRMMKECGEVSVPDRPYVIVIDEANRANLPRVLGELMFLFEYRNETVRLQYSDKFSLPSNLYFIATMNTADRSIRAIDTALRRRFETYELPPSSAILRQYHAQSDEGEVRDLIKGFEALNSSLTRQLDRHHTIGHSYFMRRPLQPADLRRVWQRQVYPLIEEYFFDLPDFAQDYEFANFWPAD